MKRKNSDTVLTPLGKYVVATIGNGVFVVLRVVIELLVLKHMPLGILVQILMGADLVMVIVVFIACLNWLVTAIEHPTKYTQVKWERDRCDWCVINLLAFVVVFVVWQEGWGVLKRLSPHLTTTVGEKTKRGGGG